MTDRSEQLHGASIPRRGIVGYLWQTAADEPVAAVAALLLGLLGIGSLLAPPVLALVQAVGTSPILFGIFGVSSVAFALIAVVRSVSRHEAGLSLGLSVSLTLLNLAAAFVQLFVSKIL